MAKPTGARQTVPYALQARTTALRFAVEAHHHALRVHDADRFQYGAAEQQRRAAALAEEHLRLTDERDYLRQEWAARRGYGGGLGV